MKQTLKANDFTGIEFTKPDGLCYMVNETPYTFNLTEDEEYCNQCENDINDFEINPTLLFNADPFLNNQEYREAVVYDVLYEHVAPISGCTEKSMNKLAKKGKIQVFIVFTATSGNQLFIPIEQIDNFTEMKEKE